MGLHIVITGNPLDGLEFYGPFKTADDAVAFGERLDPRLGDGSWWIAPLQAPEAP